MTEWAFEPALIAFLKVVMIDIVLAGDNAVVVGMAAAGLPAAQRPKAILIGIIAATVIRIALTLVATQLMQIIGLTLAGGLLLLWVCWKMWRELAEEDAAPDTADDAERAPRKTLLQAATQIVVADLSMSLDNLIAVAGAARDHPSVMVFGLVLSIALMGLAASYIARLLQRHRWITYVGLLIILYVACDMIFHGVVTVWPIVRQAVT